MALSSNGRILASQAGGSGSVPLRATNFRAVRYGLDSVPFKHADRVRVSATRPIIDVCDNFSEVVLGHIARCGASSNSASEFNALLMELADISVLETDAFGRTGSTPVWGTNFNCGFD